MERKLGVSCCYRLLYFWLFHLHHKMLLDHENHRKENRGLEESLSVRRLERSTSVLVTGAKNHTLGKGSS